MEYEKMALLERFEAKFEKGDNCWEWTAYRDHDGYGQLRVSGRQKRAHRVSWEFYVGKIPAGLCVLHRCDNPPCVNPAHLFIGTNADNVADRENKGRAARLSGMEHGSSKLTDLQVMEIRGMYSRGDVTQTRLGILFGVDHTNIGQIVRRQTWRHI